MSLTSMLRFRYRPVLGLLLLPSLLLIGVFSYYPALRSLIGGFYTWNGSPRRSTQECRSSRSTSSQRPSGRS